jgi:FkbM family methyltransferase
MAQQLDLIKITKTPGQKFARVLHETKARFKRLKRDEKAQVNKFSKWVPKGGVIFEVGAHFGYYAKEFADFHEKSCQVYCFEPVTYTRSILEKVVGSISNVFIYPFAFSSKAGVEKIYIPVKKSGKMGPGLSHLGKEQGRDYVIEIIALQTMDDFVNKMALQSLDFINCDVEGAELLVFQGGEECITRFLPTVNCEINSSHTQRMGYQPGKIFEFFLSRGYKAFRTQDKDELINVPGYIDSSGDYIFIHPTKTKIGI